MVPTDENVYVTMTKPVVFMSKDYQIRIAAQANLTHVTEQVAQRICDIVDKGLVAGLGVRVPGYCCVEAAVCMAMDIVHGDNPPTVGESIRRLKISLNDLIWRDSLSRGAGLKRLAVAQLGSAMLDQQEFAVRVRKAIIQKLLPRAITAVARELKRTGHDHSGISPRLGQLAIICENYRSDDDITSALTEIRDLSNSASDFQRYYMQNVLAEAIQPLLYSYDDTMNVAMSLPSKWCVASVQFIFRVLQYTHEVHFADTIYAEFAELVVQVLVDMESPGCQWLPPLVKQKSPWVGHYDK